MEKEWRNCALTLDKDSMQVYKGLVGDLSALRGKSPSYTTLDCVLSKVSGQQKSRELVTTVYQAEQPNCLKAYDVFFTDLWLTGSGGFIADSGVDRIVYSFLQYSIKFELQMKLQDIRAYHLCEQWSSIARVLKHPMADEADATKVLEEEASLLGRSLYTNDGNNSEVSASMYIAFISQCWRHLKDCESAYAVLADIAKLSHVSSETAEEKAATRISLLKLMDRYYLGYFFSESD